MPPSGTGYGRANPVRVPRLTRPVRRADLRRVRAWLPLLALALSLPLGEPIEGPPSRPASRPASRPKDLPPSPLFDGTFVPRIRIELPEAERGKLEAEPRAYVRAAFVDEEEGTTREVAVKLKGNAGSFREYGDRPCLTVRFDRWKKGLAYRGLAKIHLNNSVQDETLLCEWIGSRCMESAGVPVARVGHARVWLDGRDLGVYVLKEGIDRRFLATRFENPDGNHYEGAFCGDIDQDLEKESGNGCDDRSDLAALFGTTRIANLPDQWKRLPERLDVDAMIDFCAMEQLLQHWDGYTGNVNNYRIYFDPSRQGRAVFIPAGMDQLFGEPEATIWGLPAGSVARAILRNPKWREDYRARVKHFLQLVGSEELRVALLEKAKHLTPILEGLGGDAALRHTERVGELLKRIAARSQRVAEQVENPEPVPPSPEPGRPLALPHGWFPREQGGEPTLEVLESEDGGRRLGIDAGSAGACTASWRHVLVLGKGTYRFSAAADLEGVVPVEERGGVGIRISGGQASRRHAGTARRVPLTTDFSVAEELREVELVAELRAAGGLVRFDARAFVLEVRTP